MRRHLVNAVVAVCATLFVVQPAVSGANALRVGVSYLPPVDETPAARLYTEEGFEISIAWELGKLTGRPVELVHVSETARESALNNGEVDVIVARVAVGDAFPEAVDAFSTTYRSGLSVAMRSDTQARSWADLKGKIVCVTQANTAGRRYLQTLGATLSVERAPAITLAKVRTGDCDAAIHDEALLQVLFQEERWHKFSATLPAILPGELIVLFPPKSSVSLSLLREASGKIADTARWDERRERWATNVALEVYLDQDGPDCH